MSSSESEGSDGFPLISEDLELATEDAEGGEVKWGEVKSKEKYESSYKKFMTWKLVRNESSFSEDVILEYMKEMTSKYKPTSMWTWYSMLKLMLKVKHKVDISSYRTLLTFLKKHSDGYSPKKTEIFTAAQINKFLTDAPDKNFLLIKVAVIMGICGGCRKSDLVKLKTGDIEDLKNKLLVTLKDTKTKLTRNFIIPYQFYHIVKKYWGMRPATMEGDRFFVNYQKGKCTRQFVGINKLGNMPKLVASFLQLPNPHLYTGHALRRSSASIHVDSEAGALQLTRHAAWKSSTVADTVAESYSVIGSMPNNNAYRSEYVTDAIERRGPVHQKNPFSISEPFTSMEATNGGENTVPVVMNIKKENVVEAVANQSAAVNFHSHFQSDNTLNKIVHFTNCSNCTVIIQFPNQ